ncbi:MAG: YraN family protein [Pseudomonadota bacterium]
MSGLTSYLAGKAAEDSVLQLYCDHGHRLICRRWRGRGGEIDLVLEKGGQVIFVEVKKSRSFAQAAAALSQRQMRRLMASAEDCLGFFPRRSLTEMRFDVALVDDIGRVDILPNALMA